MADPARAAGLQITQGALPLSSDALRLRSLRRDLRRCRESQNDYPSLDAYRWAWREIRAEVNPLEERIQKRQATSWTDCLELAELAWWGQQYRGVDCHTDHASNALTEAVMNLGGGDRFFLWDTEEA